MDPGSEAFGVVASEVDVEWILWVASLSEGKSVMVPTPRTA